MMTLNVVFWQWNKILFHLSQKEKEWGVVLWWTKLGADRETIPIRISIIRFFLNLNNKRALLGSIIQLPGSFSLLSPSIATIVTTGALKSWDLSSFGYEMEPVAWERQVGGLCLKPVEREDNLWIPWWAIAMFAAGKLKSRFKLWSWYAPSSRKTKQNKTKTPRITV